MYVHVCAMSCAMSRNIAHVRTCMYVHACAMSCNLKENTQDTKAKKYTPYLI